MRILTATLVRMAKNGGSVNHSIDKLWYSHTMGHCTAKTNSKLTLPTVLMNFIDIMLSESSQIKRKVHTI